MTETGFTPGAGLLGGVLIGLASAGLLLANGRIAGISGILGLSFFPAAGDLGWRLSFLSGLPIGAWLTGLLLPATTALRGFSIDEGRLGWVTPPGQDGAASHVHVLAWTGDEFGEVRSIAADRLIVVR